jgi:hypothetical protein
MLFLAAGITGGMFVAGCASKDVRQETVATVNGDQIRVGELRESLGVPAGVFAVPDIPVGRKKEALDKLVDVRLLAQEGRSLGLDNTPEFKEILQRSESVVRIKTLMRNEIEGKLKVTDEEIKAVIAKVKKSQQGISDADAAVRAVEVVSWRRVKKITDDLLATAKKETAAEVDAKAMSRTGKGEDVPEDVVHARRGGSMRALAAYAKKQGVDGSEGYKSMRQEMERSVLRGMVADNVAAKNIEITDNEVEAEFSRNTDELTRRGKKIPAGIAAQLKETTRASLLNEKRKKAIEAYIAELRKKAKITVNDAILPKV